MENEILYDQNSVVIALGLLASILLAYELCFRFGRKYQRDTDAEVKTQTGAIQGGILGLLALLLGFTFNMALQRYDNRSYAVIHEVNATGTPKKRGLIKVQQNSLLELQSSALADPTMNTRSYA